MTDTPKTPQQRAADTRKARRLAAEEAANTSRVASAQAEAFAARAAALQVARRSRLRYAADLAERTVATFAEAAGGILVANAIAGGGMNVDVAHGALVAGAAAAWAIVKGALAKYLGNGNTASALPVGVDPATPPVAPPQGPPA